jgi:peptidyl-prolyl cis-trans isomerase D
MALGFMRRHRRWLYIFLWIVIAAFIILYIPALSPKAPAGSPGEVMVTVGNRDITVGEFQRAYYRQRQMYERLYQGRVDENMLKQMGLADQVLQGLVTDRLVSLEARRLGLTVPDEAVARAIATDPQNQDGGKFVGTEEIRRRLELAGMSEDDFERALREQLLRKTLQDLVTNGVFVSDAEAEREFRRRTEQVKLEYVFVDAARFQSEAKPTDEEIKARFEANPEAYRLPERRVVRYVLLDQSVLRPQVSVTDRDIEQYYGDHRDEFRQEEQACASHILIKVKSSPDGEGHTEADARRIAQTLLDRIHAGADFAALAKASSEDVGSAANGGDLGCFPPGRMVHEFDDVVFNMQPGQVSGLVRTSFGYHIIRLNSLREETTLPLEAVRDRIRQIVTSQKMTRLGDDKSQALATALAGGKSLEEAAAAQGLTVETSPPFAKGEPPPALASPSLVTRVFRMKPGEVEKEGFALPQGAAFIALAEVQPSRLPQLAEVKDRVSRDLLVEKAFADAKDLASRLRERAEKVGLERAASALSLVRKETPTLTGRGQPLGDLGRSLALEEAAFSAPEGQLSEPVRAPGPGAGKPAAADSELAGGWAVFRVLERHGFDPAAFEKEKPRIVASLRQQKQSEAFEAYIAAARDRYEVHRRNDAWRRAIGEEREEQEH